VKQWGGRFSKPIDRTVEEFNASIGFDRRLFREDILASVAHCRMLGRQGIVSHDDVAAITSGLGRVLVEFEADGPPSDVSLEDIHTAVEVRLRELVGDAAGRLHTARSRNDQVATDFRLYCRGAILDVLGLVLSLQNTLLALAAEHADSVMPGYTHLQRAQPIVLGHHLMAYVEMLERDGERLRQTYARTNVLPLGSGALAGLPYDLDREWVARVLGFNGVSLNSLDAVSDRDFALDLLGDAAILMAHLSRLNEELVVWASAEFGFVELDDAFATGSSIMPQKKNPDVAELIRGKTGRVYGDLVRLLTVVKGLPLAYNKDLQEDKEAIFDAVDAVGACLSCLAPMLASTRFRTDHLRDVAGRSASLATDIADYLVRRGLPFREAHAIVGQIVVYCVGSGKELSDLTVDEFRRFSDRFGSDVKAVTLESSVSARTTIGGTAPERVRGAIAVRAESVNQARKRLSFERDRMPTLESVLAAQ
jgi:argininosuccinate lyase